MKHLFPFAMMGLASYFTTTAIRHLGPFKEWTARGIKPLACDLCMSFWAAMAWSTGFHLAGFDSALMALPDLSKGMAAVVWWTLWTASVGGLCYLLLRKAGEPPPLPNFIESERPRRLRSAPGE